MSRALLLAILLLIPGIASSQSPQSTPDAPPQTAVPTDQPLNPALPTVFIVGDSTARNKLDLGWGDHFALFFDTTRINVANRARAGRSSRTYINEGLWAATLKEIKPGDFLLLQMGHNDGGDLGGAKPRGTLKGIGEETQDVPQTTGPLAGTTETVHTFGWYLRKMIDQAKAKGATPILLDTTVRNIWTPGPDGQPHIERDMGYNTFIHQVADQEHIAFIDMASVAADQFEALGQVKTALLFPIDHTHTSPEGAEMNARAVVTALRSAHSPLSAYLKPAATNHAAIPPSVPLTVLEDTLLRVLTNQPVNGNTAKDGAPFLCTLSEDVTIGNALAIPRGATLHGTVIRSRKAGILTGSPELTLKLVSLDLGGRSYPLYTYQFKVQGTSKTPPTETKVARGAAVGALAGGIGVSKYGKNSDTGQAANMATGAAIGAAVGTAIAAATPGPAIVIPAEAQIDFYLAAPITVPPASPQDAARLAQRVRAAGPTLYVRDDIR
jgi:rhamnogalacturonan acetylesterase